jgi:large subunit ribosomal protein L35
MPKQKTRRGAAKRFRLTGTGKLRRNKANHRHMLIRRSKSVKRKMRNAGLVDKSDERKVRRMLSV